MDYQSYTISEEHKQRLKFCRICVHKKPDVAKNAICGLINTMPTFQNHCPKFKYDREGHTQLILTTTEDYKENANVNSFFERIDYLNLALSDEFSRKKPSKFEKIIFYFYVLVFFSFFSYQLFEIFTSSKNNFLIFIPSFIILFIIFYVSVFLKKDLRKPKSDYEDNFFVETVFKNLSYYFNFVIILIALTIDFIILKKFLKDDPLLFVYSSFVVSALSAPFGLNIFNEIRKIEIINTHLILHFRKSKSFAFDEVLTFHLLKENNNNSTSYSLIIDMINGDSFSFFLPWDYKKSKNLMLILENNRSLIFEKY
jgi:hypothetical protein